MKFINYIHHLFYESKYIIGKINLNIDNLLDLVNSKFLDKIDLIMDYYMYGL